MPKETWPDWDIYVRDRCVCAYCGLSGVDQFETWMQLVIDHIVPRCTGGADNPQNKTVVCQTCNRIKGRYDPRKASNRPSSPSREELIGAVRMYMNERSGKAAYLPDFAQMMKEIREADARPPLALASPNPVSAEADVPKPR